MVKLTSSGELHCLCIVKHCVLFCNVSNRVRFYGVSVVVTSSVRSFQSELIQMKLFQ